MSLNETPMANRVHIGFFGCRNAGKSSLVNKLTNQDIAVVSDTAGTTTDPVKKAMEILPIGPVMIIDTPGYDDVGELGEMRVARTRRILNRTDAAVLVADAKSGLRSADRELIELFEAGKAEEARQLALRLMPVNAAVTTKYGIAGLKAAMEYVGLFGGEPRLPLRRASEEVRAYVRSTLVNAGIAVRDID